MKHFSVKENYILIVYEYKYMFDYESLYYFNQKQKRKWKKSRLCINVESLFMRFNFELLSFSRLSFFLKALFFLQVDIIANLLRTNIEGSKCSEDTLNTWTFHFVHLLYLRLKKCNLLLRWNNDKIVIALAIYSMRYEKDY